MIPNPSLLTDNLLIPKNDAMPYSFVEIVQDKEIVKIQQRTPLQESLFFFEGGRGRGGRGLTPLVREVAHRTASGHLRGLPKCGVESGMALLCVVK